VWTFRIVVWLVLLIVGYRGIMAIVLNETPSQQAPAASPTASTSFPVSLASAYALEFGRVYLNASPATAGRRAAQLAAFLPAGADHELGWNGVGTLTMQSEDVAGITVQNSHHAVVTLLGRVNGRLMELGVPLYASASGGLVVSGEPAWLAAPKSAVVPVAGPSTVDAPTEATLMNQLPAFFQAYASGDQVTLGRFLAPGASMRGLSGAVTYSSLTTVTVPPGGSVRQIVATVEWSIPGQPASGARAGTASTATVEMTYALTIERQHGTWYVRSIAPSTQAGGQP
jgi:hypothetical protein